MDTCGLQGPWRGRRGTMSSVLLPQAQGAHALHLDALHAVHGQTQDITRNASRARSALTCHPRSSGASQDQTDLRPWDRPWVIIHNGLYPEEWLISGSWPKHLHGGMHEDHPASQAPGMTQMLPHVVLRAIPSWRPFATLAIRTQIVISSNDIRMSSSWRRSGRGGHNTQGDLDDGHHC